MLSMRAQPQAQAALFHVCAVMLDWCATDVTHVQPAW